MLCTTSWSLEQFGWYSCGFWNMENGPLNCLLYRIFMHQSMFSPRGGRPGIQYLGYLTQCLLLWVGNRKRFDKTQNPKGGDIWQCHKRAWKLQPSSKVLGRLLLFTSFFYFFLPNPLPLPPGPMFSKTLKYWWHRLEVSLLCYRGSHVGGEKVYFMAI